jgi:hypothetical protein
MNLSIYYATFSTFITRSPRPKRLLSINPFQKFNELVPKLLASSISLCEIFTTSKSAPDPSSTVGIQFYTFQVQ